MSKLMYCHIFRLISISSPQTLIIFSWVSQRTMFTGSRSPKWFHAWMESKTFLQWNAVKICCYRLQMKGRYFNRNLMHLTSSKPIFCICDINHCQSWKNENKRTPNISCVCVRTCPLDHPRSVVFQIPLMLQPLFSLSTSRKVFGSVHCGGLRK